MQLENSEQIRNLAVVGHNDSGKTTLLAGLLYTGGVFNRQNRVEDGNTVTDFDDEEVRRGISIGLAVCYTPWSDGAARYKVNLIDCPGSGIFVHESSSGMRAADAALLCVNAASPTQVMAEKAWEIAGEMEQPVMFHLTKMDRDNIDFAGCIAELQESFDRMALPVQIPIGDGKDFAGVVDLLGRKAHMYDRDGTGRSRASEPPAELAGEIDEWRNKLTEAVAESDDELMEAYFENGDLSQEQLIQGLKAAIRSRALFPVTMSSGGHGIGNSALLDTVVQILPSPVDAPPIPAADLGGEPVELDRGDGAPVSAILFKTMNDPFTGRISLLRVAAGDMGSDTVYWNAGREEAERVGHLMHMQGKNGEDVPRLVEGDIGGVAKLKSSATGDSITSRERPVKLDFPSAPVAAISFAIEPKTKGDEEKIGEAVSRLVEEDPSLRAGRDPQTGEFLLSGAGQLHVEIAVSKLKSRSKVEVILHPPKVPYREAIKRTAVGHGRHKKQSGGRGQFADCTITMEPVATPEEYEFVDEIFGGSIPQNYRPAVEKGLLEAAGRGYLAGYPVGNFRVRLQDGKYHDVDSSEMAFKVAGSLAFKDAMAKALPTLLEPVMKVDINTTEDFMGDIMSDLSSRRGRPQGMEAKGNAQVVKATVPMAEMLTYAPALRSMTQGRSSFTMAFSHYEEVPRQIQEKIIAEAKRAEEED